MVKDGTSYNAPLLLINGVWRAGTAGTVSRVINPATEEVLDELSHASPADLDALLAAVSQGFAVWRNTRPSRRRDMMKRAVQFIKQRKEDIAVALTLEQGKPLGQSRAEVDVACGMIDWYADQAIRAYGRILAVPSAQTDGEVRKEPVGPCLLMSPWNMPVVLASRKIAGALAAGCSCIVKPPEETPSSVAQIVACFVDAGVPDGVVNLVFGVPDQISTRLVPADEIRKVSFTGSVAVGKRIAALASDGLKRLTLELGGHSPVLVFDDVDVDACVKALVAAKFRNAGQLCHAPTRFLVSGGIYQRFVDAFTGMTEALKVGPGLDESVDVGPLANGRRVEAIDSLVQDSLQSADLCTGGKRVGDAGYFYAPTVLRDVSLKTEAMTQEPFGPVALIRSFHSLDEAIELANSTRYGLASYVFTDSARTQRRLIDELNVGSIAINNTVATIAEAPFGGTLDSGYGYESGEEGLEGYLHTKFVHRTY